jgi:hypothetical protein
MPQTPRLIPNAGRTNPKPVVRRLSPVRAGRSPSSGPRVLSPVQSGPSLLPRASSLMWALPSPSPACSSSILALPLGSSSSLLCAAGAPCPVAAAPTLRGCPVAPAPGSILALPPGRGWCLVPGGNSSHHVRLPCSASSHRAPYVPDGCRPRLTRAPAAPAPFLRCRPVAAAPSCAL